MLNQEREKKTEENNENNHKFSISVDLINQVIELNFAQQLSEEIISSAIKEEIFEKIEDLLKKERALKPLKITRKKENIIQDITNLKESPQRKSKVILSQKINPINEEDEFFEVLSPSLNSQSQTEDVKPQSKRIDYKDKNMIILVEQGDLIAKKKKKKEGKKGVDIYGRTLEPQKAKTVNVLHNTSINTTEDSEYFYYYALKSGILKIDDPKSNKYKLSIWPCIVVENVDYLTGNIKMNGDVVVKGTVLDGFKVQATGNIHIYGEKGVGQADSIVSENGDIYVSSGVCGNGKTILNANNISAKYLNGVYATARDKIRLKDYCINSIINANDLTISSTKGSLYGGETRINKIFVTKLGSPNEIKTVIYFIADTNNNKEDYISEIYKKEKSLIDNIHKLNTDRNNIIQQLKQDPKISQKGNVDKNFIQKIKNLVEQLEKEIKKKEEKLKEITKEKECILKDKKTSQQKLISKYIYSNVFVYIGKDVKKVFREEQRNVCIECNGRELTVN